VKGRQPSGHPGRFACLPHRSSWRSQPGPAGRATCPVPSYAPRWNVPGRQPL